MPRLRAFLTGLLLLILLIGGIEYGLRHRIEILLPLLRPEDSLTLYGWQPSDTSFLEIVPGQTVTLPASRNPDCSLIYDQRGLRMLAADDGAAVPVLMCLGGIRVLAPDCAAQDTLTGLLQKNWPRSGSPAADSAGEPQRARVGNAGLPDGCPLLFQLHFDRLTASPGATWFCLIGPETPIADAVVRRTTEFSGRGEPVRAIHPHAPRAAPATPVAPAPPGAPPSPFPANCALFESLLPWTLELMLGPPPAAEMTGRLTLPRQLLVTNAVSAERLCLEPCLALQRRLADAGSRFVLVYLPTAEELLAPAAIDEAANSVSIERLTSAHSFRQIAREFARQQHLEYLDLTSDFLHHERPEQLFQSDRCQLSPLGHRLVAMKLQFMLAPLAEADVLTRRPEATY